MMRRFGHIIAVVVALMAAFACQRRPLENLESATSRVIVKCLWEVSVYPDGVKPDGVSFYFFRNGVYYSSITTSSVDSCEVQLPVGHYKMYMINQSPEEYWRETFQNMTSFDNASASLTETSVRWVTRSDDEAVVENPDKLLCVGVSDEFEITQEMTEEYQYYYSTWKNIRRRNGKSTTKAGGSGTTDPEEAYYEERIQYYTIRIPVYPKNTVSQLWVTIYAGNIGVLQSMRAFNSGMARTWELTKETTASERAIQLINSTQWELTYDDRPRGIGHVDGIITTFGLPDGELPSAARDSTLNVSALLVDNATVANYTFNVGDKMQVLEPNPGYRHLYRLVFGSAEDPIITFPEVRPEGGGGFTAGVEDWEDEIEVEMKL